MKTFTIVSFLCALFYFALDSAFTDMTRHDCEVNKIELACEDLKK